MAACALVGCGGGGGGDAKPAAAPSAPGPTVAQVIKAAKANAGFAKCKEVAPGAVEHPTGAGEPGTIQAILCDSLTVGHVFVYPDAAAASKGAFSQDRPYLVNGGTVVTTGEAVFAKTYDAKGALSLPAEVKAACRCGVVQGG